jgi:hypothetical protein
MASREWLAAFAKMGVRLFRESAFLQRLSGELPLASIDTRSALRSRRSLCNEAEASSSVNLGLSAVAASVSAA